MLPKRTLEIVMQTGNLCSAIDLERHKFDLYTLWRAMYGAPELWELQRSLVSYGSNVFP